MLGKKKKRQASANSHSAQAALEFLMSYGWAILVLIAGIFALAYFGVLSPDKFLPYKCTLPSGLACLDYNVESYRVILVLQNAIGQDITINKVIVSTSTQECFDDESITLKNDEKVIFTILNCNNGLENQKFDGRINISYTLEDKLDHNIAGILRAKIVTGSSISNPSICQNAENNGLCSGLDIVFGLGYQASCCSEYSLCC